MIPERIFSIPGICCMVEHIPELAGAGVTSLKIEGRAKSAYYVAVVTNAYRQALDLYEKNRNNSFCPSGF